MNNSNLHRGHIDLLRAALEGGDLQTAHSALWFENRRPEMQRIFFAITRIRIELSDAAKRHCRPSVARLIKIDVLSLASALDEPLPCLAELVISQRLQHCSSCGQSDAYVKAHGVGRSPSARLVRLIAKQWAVLPWLEQVAASAPAEGDLVGHWLSPLLATRLQRAGVLTLGALVGRINDLGLRWWIDIPSFTSSKAERITRWLRSHEQSIGIALGMSCTSSKMINFAQAGCDNILPTTKSIY